MTAQRKKAPKKKRRTRAKSPPREKPVKRIEGERLKPISLHPLEFKDALRRLISPKAGGD